MRGFTGERLKSIRLTRSDLDVEAHQGFLPNLDSCYTAKFKSIFGLETSDEFTYVGLIY